MSIHTTSAQEETVEEIAVIGLAGRFPGARDINQFWRNLLKGEESIIHFTDQELEAQGIPSEWLKKPNYVKAGTVLEEIDKFDAMFFGYSPKEAEDIDPQQRVFLETAWEALENAGYNPETYEGPIGVFAGSNPNQYLNGIPADSDVSNSASALERLIGNQLDFLCTRVSYKLNLRGPSMTVQTACSTSLVAAQLACQSLLNYQCSLALAGGVRINPKSSRGYFYQEGMISSPDGRCRAFDAEANGTVSGQGVGVVVLKRLSEARSDGDTIHAVIKGVAINNDGSLKVSYTAPSVDAQAEVIAMAQALSGVPADTIGYIEAHGTGTSLGDPIEIAALTQAFRTTTNRKGFCAIGSVKTNIGHADAAAGIAGLIKTVLILKNKQIPPSLHFKRPNPNIDFANSPFYVCTQLSEWQDKGFPRRAGVSSLGIGGTNVHAILEEAPAAHASGESRPWQLFLMSARTNGALKKVATNLLDHLKNNPQQNLSDIAYTLSMGRKAFDCRHMVVCKDRDDVVRSLETQHPALALNAHHGPANRDVVFMFSGQGSQYINMGFELYKTEAVFREHMDHCSEILRPHLALNLRDLLYPEKGSMEELAEQLKQTSITQSALFAVEYALAKLWMSWGVRPAAMVGHSIGEYVAACLSGMLSLEDALLLVVTRGRLMQQMPAGSMLAIQLSENDIQPFLGQDVSLAAVNAPSYCVASGEKDAIKRLENDLEKNKVAYTELHTSHAFHSKMMEPILDAFTQQLRQVRWKPPQIPFVSNLTGMWITGEEAMSPTYWAKHLRHTVRFSSCLQELMKDSDRIFLEVGPGHTLSMFAKQHSDESKGRVVLSSLRHPKDEISDVAFLLTTLGRLWLSGVNVDWTGFYKGEQRHRVPLPTYPFERQRYWIDRVREEDNVAHSEIALKKKSDIADWFYIPSWERSIFSHGIANSKLARSNWLVFMDECGIGPLLIKQLQQDGQDVMAVRAGSDFARTGDKVYAINPRKAGDYDALFNELQKLGKNPGRIVHLWGITKNNVNESRIDFCEKMQDLGLFSLLNIAKAVGRQDITEEIQIDVITNNMRDVTGEDLLYPEKATLLGAVKIIPLEYSNMSCRSVDIVLAESGGREEDIVLKQILTELSIKTREPGVAYRGDYRWIPVTKPIRLDQSAETIPSRLREEGVYLITGGLGGMGLTLAEYLAKTLRAKLILVGRSVFPARDEWGKWLVTHDEHDGISLKIRKLQEMEASGAELIVFGVDISNYAQMKNVIDLAKEGWGEINGVIHTAGVADYEGVIQDRSWEMTETILAPKVMGTLVMGSLLKDVDLDFFILFSSLATVVYKSQFGQVGYNAANEFLDAFAHCKGFRNRAFTVSVNWDTWQDVGMAVEAVKKKFMREGRGNLDYHSLLKDAISPSEGIDVFNRILGVAMSQVLVSTVDLQKRLERLKELESSGEGGRAESEKERSSAPYARPNLLSAYVAPRNPVEQTIADIWQALMKIEKVGIHDNFFELGGHSLLAAQVMSRIRKGLDVEIPLSQIFESPTIAGLSMVIEEIFIQEIENARMKTQAS